MKFNLIVADPPYQFSDNLTMSNVKRGSSSNYNILTDQDIIDLDIDSITSEDAILVLWVPSSKLQVGMDIMTAWGFRQTQTFIWVKTIKEPFANLIKNLRKEKKTFSSLKVFFKSIIIHLSNFDLNSIVKMNMGRLFRQGHEIALVGVKGKVYSELQNRAQKSVLLHESLKHSSKPEGLQDRLDIMFPSLKKIELFARRQRKGWLCVGNKMHIAEDIRDSIKRLNAL